MASALVLLEKGKDLGGARLSGAQKRQELATADQPQASTRSSAPGTPPLQAGVDAVPHHDITAVQPTVNADVFQARTQHSVSRTSPRAHQAKEPIRQR